MGELFTPTHLLLVLGVAFLLFGGRKLPELGKGLGEGLRGFKDAVKGGGEPPTNGSSAAKSDAHTVTPQPDPAAQANQPIQPK